MNVPSEKPFQSYILRYTDTMIGAIRILINSNKYGRRNRKIVNPFAISGFFL